MSEERGNWYLLTGFVIGIILGLVYAWLIAPQELRDTSPASLQPEFKDQYRAMIASAFVASGNLPRAEARLALLGDEDVTRVLAEQAQRTLGEGNSPLEAQALGLLAVALGQGESAALPTLETSSAPTQDRSLPGPTQSSENPGLVETSRAETPTAGAADPSPTAAGQDSQGTASVQLTATPLPTRTPTATPGAAFVLQSSTFVCDPDLANPLIQVIAEDDSGRPLSSQEVSISWESGEDFFFTGLKPEIGPGYADFWMEPGITYQVRMAAGGQAVPDITAAECETEEGARYWGSWLLVFSHP